MDNLMRFFVEDVIPDLLHDGTSNLDIVLEWVILLSNMHHEGQDKNMTPDLMVDLMWKILISELLVGIHDLGFGLSHKCLV